MGRKKGQLVGHINNLKEDDGRGATCIVNGKKEKGLAPGGDRARSLRQPNYFIVLMRKPRRHDSNLGRGRGERGGL